MLPYFVLEILTVILAAGLGAVGSVHLVSCAGNKKCRFSGEGVYTFLCLLLLTLYMGLAGSFATDFAAYIDIFQRVQEVDLIPLMTGTVYVYGEKGFLLLNWIVGRIFNTPWQYITVVALIINATILFETRRHTKHMALFLLFYINAGIYLQSYNMMRQAMAIGIVYFGTRWLEQRKYCFYILCVLLASTIHTTAFLMLAAFPFLIQRVTKSATVVKIAALVVIFLTLPQVVSFVQRFRYASTTYGLTGASLNSVIVQIFICLYVLFCAYCGVLDCECVQHRIMVNATMLFLGAEILSFRIMQLQRIGFYFSTYTMVAAVEATFRLPFQQKRNHWALACAVGALLILYGLVWITDSPYEPYTFFGQN